MKPITREWLKFAEKDLVSCERLLDDPFLAGIVCFHAQQAVEKSFKAVVEEFEIGFVKTHDLVNLFGQVKERLEFELDTEMIKTLNEIYISARYPGEFGLLPEGEPGIDDARLFYSFAQVTFTKISRMLAKPAEE